MTAYRVRVRRSGTDPSLPGAPTVTVGAVDPEASSSGVIGATAFVFRPGGVPDTNVYPAFPSLYADWITVQGPKILEFDDSIAPVIVPDGGADYDMTDGEWRGHRPAGWPATQVAVADGATFIGLRRFCRNLQVTFLSSAPSAVPCTDFVANDKLSLDDMAAVLTGGDLPAFRATSLFIELHLDQSSFVGDGHLGVIDIAGAGGGLTTYIGQGSVVAELALSGNATADLYHYLLSPSARVYQPQTNWPGTAQIDGSIDQAFRLNPPSGTVPAIADGAMQFGDLRRLNATAGVFAQTLPSIGAAGAMQSPGRWVGIKETSGVDGITAAAAGAETINGAPTYALPPGGTAMFNSDGFSNWMAIGIDMNHVLNRLNTFTRAQGTAQVSLVDGTAVDPTVDVDAEDSNVFFLQMTDIVGATREFQFPTGLVAGFTYMFVIRNTVAPDAIQAFTFAGASGFYFPGGVAPVPTAANVGLDVVTFVAIDINPGGAPNIILLNVPQANFLEI